MQTVNPKRTLFNLEIKRLNKSQILKNIINLVWHTRYELVLWFIPAGHAKQLPYVPIESEYGPTLRIHYIKYYASVV